MKNDFELRCSDNAVRLTRDLPNSLVVVYVEYVSEVDNLTYPHMLGVCRVCAFTTKKGCAGEFCKLPQCL